MPTRFAKARRSPKVTQKATRSGTGGTVRVKRAADPEEALPPIVLLRSGSASGVLDISPEKALDVLRSYQAAAQRSISGWERTLCSNHAIKPSTLALLARILNRCPSPAQRHLARKLMLSASALNEPSATYELVAAVLHSPTLLQHADFAAPLQKLRTMAQTEHDPQAMVLLGRVSLLLANQDEALVWFRKSTEKSCGFEGAGEALVQEGRILLGKGERGGAERAFRKAAMEVDEPSGFFYLSQLQEMGSREQEIYLLKAAGAGIVEACHNLGSLEMGKVGEGGREGRSMAMAREWFEVAAADGFAPSMLNLAELCRVDGRKEEGLMWLDRAEGLGKEVAKEVGRIRDQWRTSRVS